MKIPTATLVLLVLAPWLAVAEEAPAEDATAKHAEGSAKVADLQDELSADVQQLAAEQTVKQVMDLLNKVEEIMDETTDKLAGSETGGDTIAAQTEIIEKIHEAAKEKKKQQGGGGQSGDAMMDMMERMMGKKAEGDAPGQGKGGDKKGEQGGKGATGESDTASENATGDASGKTEARRVPKASGTAGHAMPEEFRKALDAYNRGAEQKVK